MHCPELSLAHHVKRWAVGSALRLSIQESTEDVRWRYLTVGYDAADGRCHAVKKPLACIVFPVPSAAGAALLPDYRCQMNSGCTAFGFNVLSAPIAHRSHAGMRGGESDGSPAGERSACLAAIGTAKVKRECSVAFGLTMARIDVLPQPGHPHGSLSAAKSAISLGCARWWRGAPRPLVQGTVPIGNRSICTRA